MEFPSENLNTKSLQSYRWNIRWKIGFHYSVGNTFFFNYRRTWPSVTLVAVEKFHLTLHRALLPSLSLSLFFSYLSSPLHLCNPPPPEHPRPTGEHHRAPSTLSLVLYGHCRRRAWLPPRSPHYLPSSFSSSLCLLSFHCLREP